MLYTQLPLYHPGDNKLIIPLSLSHIHDGGKKSMLVPLSVSHLIILGHILGVTCYLVAMAT